MDIFISKSVPLIVWGNFYTPKRPIQMGNILKAKMCYRGQKIKGQGKRSWNQIVESSQYIQLFWFFWKNLLFNGLLGSYWTFSCLQNLGLLRFLSQKFSLKALWEIKTSTCSIWFFKQYEGPFWPLCHSNSKLLKLCILQYPITTK